MHALEISGWLALASAFAWICGRFRWLSAGGAIASGVLGVSVVFLAGPLWLVPLLFFFGSSVLLGKVLKPLGQRTSDAKQGEPRDAMQVLCNGLPYGLCAVAVRVWHPHLGELGMFASMAVATADTWSSEIGIVAGGRTVDIARWRTVAVGRSGGISWAGTFGGLAGVIALIGFLALPLFPSMDLAHAWKFIAAGMGGMLLDSLLGSLFQARYRTQDGSISDQGDQFAGGVRWMTNDVVNLLSNAIATAAAVILLN